MRAREYGIDMFDTQALERGESTALVRLRREHEEQQYFTIVSPHMHAPKFHDYGPWAGTPLLVLGARITPRNADHLRELGINFIDINGNAYFSFGNVLVDVRGRSGDRLASQYQARATVSNLFTPKRAQIIFALISWPEIVNAPLREIARVAGVSVGFAQRTVAALEAAGYIRAIAGGREGRRLNDIDSLIDGWVASFRAAFGSPERTRAFRGQFDREALSEEGAPVYVSGEAAADWIARNSTWTLYSDEIPREAAAAGRWVARASDSNIFVRPVFWNEPEASQGPRLRTAPPLLVYADLMTSGDSRQREAAGHLRSEHADLRAR